MVGATYIVFCSDIVLVCAGNVSSITYRIFADVEIAAVVCTSYAFPLLITSLAKSVFAEISKSILVKKAAHHSTLVSGYSFSLKSI